MNVHTALRMAAAGAGGPATWVQIRLSMMDSVLPWRDPDGVFVSLTESLAGGWVITNNYNGAGGVNDGISEMVAWKTASIGAVIPRFGSALLTRTMLVEYVAKLVSGIPADAAAWQPQMVAGTVINANATFTIGAGLSCPSAGSAGSRGYNATAPGSGTTNANTRAILGWSVLGNQQAGLANAGGLTAAGVATNAPSTFAGNNSATGGITSTGIVVCQGNAVSNPVAGNRSCATKFYVRIFDLPTSLAPWVDATGWTVLGCTSPFDVTTPTSDPNSLFSSADTSNAPEWRVTLADTGKTGPFDGYTEGLQYTAARPADLDYQIPTVWAIQVTSITAYSGTQRYGVSVGLLDATGAGAGVQGMNNVPAIGATTIDATANNLPGTFSNWPGTADGSIGMTLPQWSTSGTIYAGCTYSEAQLSGAPIFGIGNSAPGLVAMTSATKVMMNVTKDTNTLGTSNPELRWKAWYAHPTGYQRDWPT